VDPIIDSEERLNNKQIATFTSSIAQFNKCEALLRDMDKEIVATNQGEDEVEAEIVESAAIQEAISDKLSQIKSVLDATSTPTLNASAPVFVPSDQPIVSELPVVTQHREQVS